MLVLLPRNGDVLTPPFVLDTDMRIAAPWNSNGPLPANGGAVAPPVASPAAKGHGLPGGVAIAVPVLPPRTMPVARGSAPRWTGSVMAGALVSAIAHLFVVVMIVAGLGRAPTLDEDRVIPVEVISVPAIPGSPAKASEFSVPFPPVPQAMPADLLPPVRIDLPEPQATLPDDLLQGPDLPVAAPPPPLAAELNPPVIVDHPPAPPDPAGVLAAAAPKQKRAEPNTGTPLRKPPLPKRAQSNRPPEADPRADRLRQQRRQAREAARKATQARQETARAKAAARRSAGRVSPGGQRAQPGVRGQAGSTAAAAAYRGVVAARLARNKPRGDVALLGQGTAVVAFQIAQSGAAVGIRITRSAGSPALDRAALATIRRSSPFPPPPRGAGRAFRVPVRFSR